LNFGLQACTRENTGDLTMVDKFDENDLVYRLSKRAEIRRQITSRKSVKEGKPDRIADLLEEAADEISILREQLRDMETK
jgi:hypothetical protein